MDKTPVHIDREALTILMSKQRQDIRKGICTIGEALEILSISKSDFFTQLKDDNTSIIPSKKKGKYIYSSIIREFKRIHGVSYNEATEAA